jgi:hypothetical protein
MTPRPARKIREQVEDEARRERERLQAAEAARIAAAHAQLQRELEERYQARYLAATAAAVAAAAEALDEEWDFRVVDADLLPRAYLLGPDEDAIRRVVRRDKDKTQIPGVEVYVRVATAVRRA